MPKYESTLPHNGVAYISDSFVQGKKITEIKRGLLDMGYRMEERNLYYIRKKWIANDELQSKIENVDWENINKLITTNVRVDHLPKLREVSAWATTIFGPSKIFDPTPTYMSLKWQSYLLTYTSTVHLPIDIWTIGELFALRETNALLSKQPIKKDDLEAWITFAPWENRLKRQAYLDAIENGIIPTLKPVIDDHERSFFRAAIATTLANIREPHYFLPSRQIEKNRGITLTYRIPVGVGKSDVTFHFPEKTAPKLSSQEPDKIEQTEAILIDDTRNQTFTNEQGITEHLLDVLD